MGGCKPISSEDLVEVTRDPQGYLRELSHGEQASRWNALDEQERQEQLAHWMTVASVAGAACASGATAAATTAFTRSLSQIAAVRSGALTPTAAAMAAASDATAAFARGAIVGGGGQAISLISDGMGLADALGGGTLPFAIARAGLSLGEVTAAYARGQITAADAAQRSVQSVSKIAVAWAGCLVGQVIIPVPVVGAVIGGTVASLSCSLAAQGIAAVSSEINAAAEAEEVLAATRVEIAAALIVLDEELRLIDNLACDWDFAFSTRVMPSLNTLVEVVPEGETSQALDSICQLITAYHGTPLFKSTAEFDVWMRNQDPLVLRTRPGPG